MFITQRNSVFLQKHDRAKQALRFGIPVLFMLLSTSLPAKDAFQIEEASIADVHRAIQKGQVTCQQVVQSYIDRARAYNGV